MRDWLKEIRKERALTQEDVASRAFISRAYYAQIEIGSRNPSYEIAQNIGKVLNICPSAFYTNISSEYFQLALRNSSIILAHCDLDLRYTWIFNPHSDFSSEDSIGKRDDELSVNSGTLELMNLKRKVITENKPIKKKVCFPLSNGVHCYYVYGEPLRNKHDEVIGVITASMDISDLA